MTSVTREWESSHGRAACGPAANTSRIIVYPIRYSVLSLVSNAFQIASNIQSGVTCDCIVPHKNRLA